MDLAPATGFEHSHAALAPGVHCAVVDEDLVFLDLTVGAYSCLASGAAAIRFGPGRALSIADDALTAELGAARLVAAARPQDAVSVRTPAPPTASALRWSYPAPQLADLAPLTHAVADVLIGYRNRSLAQILTSCAGPPPAAAPTAALLDEVDCFHRWIPFAPLSGKCLLRAFVLRRFLARRGHGVDWVFGVATWPFSAHCWLQAGGVVLDDTVERVSRYTPILVV